MSPPTGRRPANSRATTSAGSAVGNHKRRVGGEPATTSAGSASEGADEEGGALAGDAGHHEGGASCSPCSDSRLRSSSGTTSTPRFLIVSRPMPRAAQGRLERLLLVGQLLEHLVGARERGGERLVAGHVGDVLVDQAAVDAGRDGGHEAGPDHRAVGLVEAPPDRPRRRRGRGRPRRSATPARAPRITVARRRDGRQLRRPQRGLLHVALVGDPLGLDPVGQQRCGMPGATLTHRRALQQPGHEVPAAATSRPRRTPVPEPYDGRGRRTRRRSRRGRRPRPRRPARPRRARGRRGSRGPPPPAARRGRRPRRSARPAPARPGRRRCRSRGRAPTAGGDIATRAARCVATRAPGGLLEALGREVHPGGVVAELRHGARRAGPTWVSAAAACAGSASPAVAQRGGGAHRVAGVVDVQLAWPGPAAPGRGR